MIDLLAGLFEILIAFLGTLYYLGVLVVWGIVGNGGNP